MAEDPEWEYVEPPPEVEFAMNTAESATGVVQENYAKDATQERLCGYLSKLGAKGLKTWKERWFVFEPRKCTLYYYRTRNCTDPLGNIDIASATFSLSTNPSLKEFEIRAGERAYQLKAPDKETVQFWLQQLKAERAKFTRRQSSMCGETRSSSSGLRPTSGLLASPSGPENGEDVTDDLVSFSEPIKKPATVGEASKSESSQSISNLSLSNIRTELKNWRSLSPINEGNGNQKPVKLREPKASSRGVDFGFLKMSAALKRRTFWGTQSVSVDQQNIKETCQDCEEFKQILSSLKEAIQIAEKEIRTRDDVIESLHEQIRYEVTNKSPTGTKAEMDPDSLEEKDLYIEKLSNILKKLKQENEDLQIRLDDKNNKIDEMVEKNNVLEEMITNKDSEIVALTNQIFTIEHPETAEDASEETPVVSEMQSPLKQEETEDQLKEKCNAYVEQNKLLNSEILELTRLRKLDNDIIKDREARIVELEAQLCKIRSRYSVLLNERSASPGDALDNLINQTYAADGQQKSPTSPKLADRYGFYEGSDTEAEEGLFDKLLETRTGLNEVSVGDRWEAFLLAQGTKPIEKTEEVKGLVRQGIPHEYRARVWLGLVNHYVRHERKVAGPGYFHSLLKDKQSSYTPASKQIELDLLRTLPNNKFYVNMDSPGIAKLRNVLLAFSWHNPNVGYCQGLNRLGAIALLYLNEEDAFWCLVAIVEHLMPPDYYGSTLIGAQIDQRVLKDLLDEKLPKLSQMFQTLGVDLSLLSFNWFLVVYGDIFRIEFVLRVWDTFLFEGNKVLFRYALAIFKSCEEDLLKFRDCSEVFAYFRRLPSHRTSPHRVSQIAFHQMNPFPKKNIMTKRAYHKPKLEAELREFETMRQDKTERDSRKESEILSDGDDDD
ncbi:TBC1 domain family member 2B-like isoform X2 [Rhopilema esculentum]|uniref:TBC1 domain family member 2B-like isoform X2 n=1 Tax=Rhopilema esculentum TaxID=499914 RepID=UPI0031D02D65